MTVMQDMGIGGHKETIDQKPFFIGQIELTQISDGCVSGVLHAFSVSEPDPAVSVPELNGAFIAPTC